MLASFGFTIHAGNNPGNKAICFFGDSYVANHMRQYSETWHAKASERLGLKYINAGRNGSAILFDRSTEGFGPPMIERCEQLPDDLDCIVIIAGHNDASMIKTEDELSKFKGALNELVLKLKAKYPYASVGYVLPWNVDTGYFRQVREAINEICQLNGIITFDAEKAGRIKVNDPEFRSKFFQNNGVHDTAHLNDHGHNLIVDEGVKFISSLMGEPSEGLTLIWNDDFTEDGKLSDHRWNFENGFVRNNELQWYQSENAFCRNGMLEIEARTENRKNPVFDKNSDHWAHNREVIECTSSSVNTKDKFDFQYGTMIVRAKIPTADGAWPAIWTLGKEMEWPSNGEIDIMEYYRIDGIPHILANAAWGTERRYNAKWNSKTIPFSHFTAKDQAWDEKFHIWKMDWDENSIKIYLDDELINDIALSETVNGSLGNYKNPMRQPHYILLNLAIGGDHGGNLSEKSLPMKYVIDYVRIYQ